jgi:hypothetical protein
MRQDKFATPSKNEASFEKTKNQGSLGKNVSISIVQIKLI